MARAGLTVTGIDADEPSIERARAQDCDSITYVVGDIFETGPVTPAGTIEIEWPENIVVDSTEFQYTNRKTGHAGRLFCVLAAWEAFYAEVTSGSYPTAARWARHWNKRMKAQTPGRASLPPHYASGAIEPKLATVRQILQPRRWTFRNRRRMNTLLELVRQRLNRTDDFPRWAGLIWVDLESGGGKPSHPRRMADPVSYDTAGERIYLLPG